VTDVPFDPSLLPGATKTLADLPLSRSLAQLSKPIMEMSSVGKTLSLLGLPKSIMDESIYGKARQLAQLQKPIWQQLPYENATALSFLPTSLTDRIIESALKPAQLPPLLKDLPYGKSSNLSILPKWITDESLSGKMLKLAKETPNPWAKFKQDVLGLSTYQQGLTGALLKTTPAMDAYKNLFNRPSDPFTSLQQNILRSSNHSFEMAATISKASTIQEVHKKLFPYIDSLNLPSTLASLSKPIGKGSPLSNAQLMGGAFTNWSTPSSIQAALKSTALDDIFKLLNNSQFNTLVAQTRKRVADHVAGGFVPTTATAAAVAICENDVQFIVDAVSEAVIAHLDAKDAADPKRDAFVKYWYPFLLFVIGCIVSILADPIWHAVSNWHDHVLQDDPASLVSESSQRVANQLYVVISPEVLMRLGPHTQQRFVDRIPQDAVVKVLRQQGQWSKVRYGNHTGWVKSKYLRTLASVASNMVSVELVKNTIHED
jgi:hypothetical protein